MVVSSGRTHLAHELHVVHVHYVPPQQLGDIVGQRLQRQASQHGHHVPAAVVHVVQLRLVLVRFVRVRLPSPSNPSATARRPSRRVCGPEGIQTSAHAS
jgi:hypothetical protein